MVDDNTITRVATNQVPETLDMDSNGHTNFKQLNRIAVSRSAAILIILVFLTTVVTTGLLVYHFASCSKATYSHHTTGGDTTHPVDCPTTSHPASVSPPAPPPVTESVTTTVAVQPTDVPPAPDAVKNVRLPTSVVPVAYTLALVPFIYENFSFTGDVRILINVTAAATENVTLHAVDLDVDVDTVYVREYAGEAEGEDLTVESGRAVQVPIERTSNDSARQFFVVHLGRPLEEGKQYVVGMRFVGVLNDLLQGFYRSSYMVGNETRWIAATQFQATDARRAFPCFDEPALKATFKISLARPANMSTISNMPKLERSEAVENISNYVWDHYPVSVPMSTYLVAFIVSDFEHITNGTLSIWARKSAINQARFGLEIGPSILKYYEEYFQIKFPLPKIDMIALPDFSAGAMENWGLITYRESVLLYEEGISTVYNLQGISVVIAHELAHQWFGNLVTPSWWSDLWLNEGFASYLENIGTNSVRPEWRMMDQFVVHDLQNVFALDALSASHQISIEVENPDEINEIFDRISYAKGATIIRMMEHFLTTAVFKQGLTNFLNAKKYGSATQDDLWEALTLEGHKQDTLHPSLSVKSIMDTWTLQTGYPVVTVTRNYEKNTADLSQNKFSLNEDVTNSTLKWWIPITYTTPSIPLNNSWISSTQDSIEISDIKQDDWLLVNVKETGYYRVNYDKENWLKLTKELMDKSEFAKTFDPKNRAQMLDDCLNLALAGYLDYDIALNVTRYLVNERDYVPWKAAFNAFDFFSERFMRTGHFDKLKKYMKYLMGDLYNALGFKGHAKDTQLETYLRKETLTRSCQMGHVDCVHDSVVMYQNWRITPDPDRNNPIPPNLKILVYCTAIQIGNQEEWDFAWERFLNANVGSEREILMSALGCSRETWILSRYLEWTITPGSGIRKQDAFRVFGSVTDNIIGQDLAFRFLKGNWDRIRKYMGSSILGLNGIVRAVTSKLSAREDVEELKLFASNRSSELGPAARTIQQSVEQVEANLRWMDTYYDKIVTWLTITNNYNDVISINQT